MFAELKMSAEPFPFQKTNSFTSKNKVKSVYYICFNFAARGKFVANSSIHLHFCKGVGKYEVT